MSAKEKVREKAVRLLGKGEVEKRSCDRNYYKHLSKITQLIKIQKTVSEPKKLLLKGFIPLGFIKLIRCRTVCHIFKNRVDLILPHQLLKENELRSSFTSKS